MMLPRGNDLEGRSESMRYSYQASPVPVPAHCHGQLVYETIQSAVATWQQTAATATHERRLSLGKG